MFLYGGISVEQQTDEGCCDSDYADCRRGNRPGFDPAAPPELANSLYEQYVSGLRAEGLPVETGVFQAHMAVELINDGPVTIMLETPAKA